MTISRLLVPCTTWKVHNAEYLIAVSFTALLLLQSAAGSLSTAREPLMQTCIGLCRVAQSAACAMQLLAGSQID